MSFKNYENGLNYRGELSRQLDHGTSVSGNNNFAYTHRCTCACSLSLSLSLPLSSLQGLLLAVRVCLLQLCLSCL